MSTLKIVTAAALGAVVANDKSRVFVFEQYKSMNSTISKVVERFLEKRVPATNNEPKEATNNDGALIESGTSVDGIS